jgi:hypothetical protein
MIREQMCTAIPPELAVDLLAFSGVHPGAHVHAELLNRHHDRRSARERARRLGERRKEPVARGVLLAAAVTLQLLADEPAEPGQQFPPAGVAQLRRECGGADDVQEQHRREAAPHVVAWHGSIIRLAARAA